MNNSAIIQDFINQISFNGFTANQMRVMLCNIVESMSDSEAAALLDTIGMSLDDIT